MHFCRLCGKVGLGISHHHQEQAVTVVPGGMPWMNQSRMMMGLISEGASGVTHSCDVLR